MLGLSAAVLLLSCSQPMHRDLGYPPLWQVESAQHDNEVWLFGTVHIMPKGKSSRLQTVQRVLSGISPRMQRAPWVSNQLFSAVKKSQRLVIELDLNRALRNDQTRLLAHVREEMLDITAVLPDARQLPTLQDYDFDDDLLHMLQTEASSRNLVFSDMTDLTLPAILLLFSVAPSDRFTTQAQPGAEDWLMAMMRLHDRRISGLEQRDSRLQALTTVFVQSQVDEHETIMRDYLATSLSSSDDIEADLMRVYAEWLGGDSPERQRSRALFTQRYPEIYQAFVSQRNVLWLDEIVRHIDSGERVFIAVGEAHLYGPDNLREMLVREGYRIQRIQ